MDYIITLSCPDKPGLVLAVSTWLVANSCNILDSDQFRDGSNNTFFMRVHFEGEAKLKALEHSFEPVATGNQISWQIWPCSQKPKVLIMVSKQEHCLTDLLFRAKNGELPIEIVLVASNHLEAKPIAAAQNIDFRHLPIDPDSKTAQEKLLLEEIAQRKINIVVLARYMQILSPEFCHAMVGKIINIHHSFLPGFKGAKPYHQAFEHGVKLIGATAHYVTAELDEGPIIEQGIERVGHRNTVSDLVNVGRDIERVVLAKAVKYHAEHRVLMNGHRTVVFH
jgi:formyltetrahydrofolate deformylase|tara:strand:- start:111 stop:950 length:840 start_codon:yes stop_codon:yes gene_type:complete